MFNGTIATYPERGVGGKSSYRGNCSPKFVTDYLLTFNPNKGLTIDPMEGSGTTKDVCTQLDIPYKGFDLRYGFDSRRNRLRDHLEAPAKAAFIHPPYAGMIHYSRDVWGNGEEHPADLSIHGTNIEGFLSDLQEVLYNVFDALAVGATYGVLLGLWRHPKTKELIHLPARLFPYCPGAFENEIVKGQFNTMSGRNDYGKRPFVMTTHEIFYVFRKTANSMVGSVINSFDIADAVKTTTWLNLVRSFALKKKRFTVEEAYTALCDHPHVQNNDNKRAKIRQKLQQLVKSGDLERLGIGEYLVAA